MLNQRKYRIYNGSKLVGTFILSDGLKVTMIDGLGLIDIPMEFYKEYCQGQRVFKDLSVTKWIRNRVVPSGRQNINSILKQVGIDKYDELSIFLYTNGKYTQDDFRIELMSKNEGG